MEFEKSLGLRNRQFARAQGLRLRVYGLRVWVGMGRGGRGGGGGGGAEGGVIVVVAASLGQLFRMLQKACHFCGSPRRSFCKLPLLLLHVRRWS